MEKLYIVIPAYNEEATIKNVLETWVPIVEKTGSQNRLVVINDGSHDKTQNILTDFAQTHVQFIPLEKQNGGHGDTVLFGYNYALDEGADFVFQTDSDGQTDPNEFWQFWEVRHDFDMVIGHRKGRKDGFSRIIVTKTLKAILKISFGVSITDANTPFRLMKATSLKNALLLVPPHFNLPNVLLSVIFAKKNFKVKYFPITFLPRQGGVNSINLKKIIKIGVRAIKDFRKIRKELNASLGTVQND